MCIQLNLKKKDKMKKTIFYLMSAISFSNTLMAIGSDQEKRSIE